MRIFETGLQFGGLQARSKTDLIVLHHSASADVSAAEIHGWHRAKGWAGIGYHFVIRKNGSIERGRPQEMIGAHAGAGVNVHSIGICLCGNFMQERPNDSQLLSLVELVVWLKKVYRVPADTDVGVGAMAGKGAGVRDSVGDFAGVGSGVEAGVSGEPEVKLHREVAATACPGNCFPVEEFKGLLQLAMAEHDGQSLEDWKVQVMQKAKAAGLIKDDHHPDDPAPKWFVLTVALNTLKLRN